jgi:diguanylate cyclase (GGDEF)-like protein
MATGVGLLLGSGWVTPQWSTLNGIGVGAVTIATALSSRRKWRTAGEARLRTDVEVGLLSLVATEGLLFITDASLDGPWSPLFYFWVSFCTLALQPRASLIAVTGALALELEIRSVSLHETNYTPFGLRAMFTLLFTAINLVFLRAEVARLRARAKAHVQETIDRLKEDARSYRLLGAGEPKQPSVETEDRLTRSSVEEIHQSVHFALQLLQQSLGLHSAVLLWMNAGESHLRVSEAASASELLNDAPFSAMDGVLGAVVAQKKTLTLSNLKPSFRVPYYRDGVRVRSFMAIPVLAHGKLRGVLALDREDSVPFSPQDEEISRQAADFCLRAIENERLFVQLERAKVEQGKLYRAAQALGGALSEREVLEAGVKAAREIASFDLAAVTVYDEVNKSHEVCAVTSAAGELDAIAGARFGHNNGLVSMVVENRFPLPYRGEHDPHQVVLSKRLGWPKYSSLLVLPLLMRDRALGTLVLGSKRRHAFGDSVRSTLEVLASHLAVSLANVRMVQALETMATTDGLTGLLNKRAMFDQASQKIASATRFKRKFSLLVTDIDFFKRVNDTYGHDVGDQVIVGLGEILKKQKRTTDIVARFGGEEFVLLCEQTDAEGALLLAERIREEMKRTQFHSEHGTFSVTCSLGVATFPEAGKSWEELFRAADEALYASKRSGRDRVSVWAPAKHSDVKGLGAKARKNG